MDGRAYAGIRREQLFGQLNSNALTLARGMSALTTVSGHSCPPEVAGSFYF